MSIAAWMNWTVAEQRGTRRYSFQMQFLVCFVCRVNPQPVSGLFLASLLGEHWKELVQFLCCSVSAVNCDVWTQSQPLCSGSGQEQRTGKFDAISHCHRFAVPSESPLKLLRIGFMMVVLCRNTKANCICCHHLGLVPHSVLHGHLSRIVELFVF